MTAGARSRNWSCALLSSGRRFLKVLCLAAPFAATLPLACIAAEGFFSDRLPPAVRSIWPSVYAFVCESRSSSYTATAFLVGRKGRGDRADYYFITAGHAIGDCKHPQRYLVENINQLGFESDGITLAPSPQRLKGVQLVYLDDAYDIAVVKVEAAAGLKIGSPLIADDTCDGALNHEIYAVGFPGVSKRRSLHLAREAKRWSKGDYVGLGRAEFRGAKSTYIAATVDSLPGNSGGPVVDAKGTLIGVLVQGAAAADNGFRYDVDPKQPKDWQSFLVPCGQVARILEKNGLK